MKILVINCGSSSLKYQLFDMENEEVLVKGLVERIGIDESRLKQEKGDDEFIIEEGQKKYYLKMLLLGNKLLHYYTYY